MSSNHEHTLSSHSKPELIRITLSLILALMGAAIEFNWFNFTLGKENQFYFYIAAYLIIGLPVIKNAVLLVFERDFFNELTLMSIATIGAMFIGEYLESIGVMIFYTIGEIIQDNAAARAKGNIKALLDIRPDVAYLVSDDGSIIEEVSPEQVNIGDIVEIKTGGKVPLDGLLLTDPSAFNTAALTGESVPRMIKTGEQVLSGMISSDKVVRIKVNRSYENSALSRILKIVQEASECKSPTEQFIRKFARVYTPIVFGLALLIMFVPYFVVSDYVFRHWFYTALVFLVLSCPCALVISVPLAYFGGIGLGSLNGVLFKGGNYLEAMLNLKTLVTDKTGTITKGVFKVQDIESYNNVDSNTLMSYLASLEMRSSHPIAKSISDYAKEYNIPIVAVSSVEEMAGFGLKAELNGLQIAAGNSRLMDKLHISIPEKFRSISKTKILVAYDHQFIGSVVVADELKDDAQFAVEQMHACGVRMIMLSGDKKELTKEIASSIGIDEYYGEMMPEDKAAFLLEYKKAHPSQVTAFVGDGINDAPVLALSDIGIAMGGLGSDLAIETADVIIQSDEPSKIAVAIHIARETRKIAVQNIVFALSVKLLILILGTFGLAGMWHAVFADVGVSVLAILNSTRLQFKKFDQFDFHHQLQEGKVNLQKKMSQN
ncbi:MAG: heavy metal translocating P-type ATPase [Brevinemataceae bacterium]